MRYWLFACLLLVQPARAQEDVGLVNQMAGEVTFQGGKAKAFMKVREGDRFELPAGAQLRLVYFAGARQESWQGPASLRAGKRESAPLAGKPAAVTILPASVPQRLARIPQLAQGNSVFGGVAVRGTKPAVAQVESEESLREARATYARLRRELPADDLTPELFLYAALVGGPDPDSEEVRSLAARLRERQER
ncbi:MAG TPA: hypothetical protein VGO02_05300 [Burkholderiales bacterium]|nr:hypothetical protein [Burkholderiales bacterium]